MRYSTQKAEARLPLPLLRWINVLKTVPRCKLRDLLKFATLLLITLQTKSHPSQTTHSRFSWH